MGEKLTIGGHSRWFTLVVLLTLLFVLFASMLAVGAVDQPDSGVSAGGQGEDDSSEDNNTSSSNGSTQEDNPSDSEETAGESAEGSSGGASSYGGTSGGGYPEQSTVGGSITLSNQPELRIESPEPSRWRLGGYGRYTGAGWERDSNPEPLREPLPPSASGSSAPEYAIQVEVLRPFRSLATVWKPFAGEADQTVSVTDQQGLVVDDPIDTNETYTTITYGPPSRSEATTATGTVPPAIHEQYTQLPSDTPDRLIEKTAQITTGADTQYEAAAAVKRWLQTNKRYSLDAEHDRGNDVATEFVFEMDAGYCQYFATAMAAMLRTQDIPARYVTGYTTGEQVAENTYLVRGKNAHAWVEVYFADVGWVPFDPTPGGGRIDAGRSESVSEPPLEQEQNDPEEDDSEQEDPADSDEDSADNSDDQSEEEIPGPPYDISLSPDPVPGETVDVTVQKDGEPVAGVEVSFNREPVGRTSDAGTVQGTVPYATELTVSAERPSDNTLSANSIRWIAGASGGASETFFFAPAGTAQTAENSSVSYDIPTAVTVQTETVVLPGRSVAANMSLNGSAISGLDVLIYGETVATTDEDGEFSLPVPANATLDSSLPVRFEREEFGGEGSVAVADVELEIETGIFKLPGTSADVTATAVDGDRQVPLEDAPIQTNGGDPAKTTDGKGTAAMTLPWSNEGTATVVVGESTVTASISGILLQLLAVLAVSVAALVGAGVWVWRNTDRVRQLKRWAVGALVTAGTVLRQIGHWIYIVPRFVYRHLLTLAVGLREYAARLQNELTLAALLSPVRYLVAGVTGLLAWISALPTMIRGILSAESSGQSQEDSGSGARGSDMSGTEPDERRAYRRLRQYWYWLVRKVVRQSQTKTAVEVEKRAAEKGFPLRPVRRLRRAFQDVEYGFANPDDRVDIAEESVDQLQEETEDTEQ